ncbi:MAG: peroxiredoxin [Clostridiaceae bacterium]
MNELQITEGSLAPVFSLPGSDGKEHKLSDYTGKKVVLYFYPRDNTAGCSRQAEAFRDTHNELLDLNAIVLGISRDTLASHDKFITKFSLPFILLSDSSEEVSTLYDVLKEKNLYGKKSIGIERSTFIIDEEGKIERIYRKVKVPGHVANIVEYLKDKSI